MSPDVRAIHEAFRYTFNVRIADTEELRLQAYRLRHQVYCIEKQFEAPCSGGIETDRFDDRAPHALLFHRGREEPLGTARLVLPDPEHATGGLPIQEICAPEALTIFDLPLSRTGEISRFALSRERVRHLIAAAPGDGAMRQVFSLACLGLIAGLRHIARANGVTHAVAVMEAALHRRLGMLGVPFDALGTPVRHHGWRIPCHISLDRLELGLQRRRPDLWPIFAADCAIPLFTQPLRAKVA